MEYDRDDQYYEDHRIADDDESVLATTKHFLEERAKRIVIRPRGQDGSRNMTAWFLKEDL